MPARTPCPTGAPIFFTQEDRTDINVRSGFLPERCRRLQKRPNDIRNMHDQVAKPIDMNVLPSIEQHLKPRNNKFS